MSTLVKLVADGVLFEIEGDLEPGICPVRYLYGTEEFRPFLDGLHNQASVWNLDQTPAQQFDDLLYEYLGTEPFATGERFGPIRPARGKNWPGVWELKTADIRIFGWFPEKNKFIAVYGCDASKVKDYNLYAGFRDQVVRVRDELSLDEPKFVDGKDFGDVISLLYLT